MSPQPPSGIERGTADGSDRTEHTDAPDEDASRRSDGSDLVDAATDREPAPPSPHSATASTGDLPRDDDGRRRWLDSVLEALNAASQSGPATGRPRDGLDVDAVVPGLGPVQLKLSWAEGVLRVTLRCSAAQGVPNLAGNPHTEALRQALHARVPPVAFEVAGTEAPASTKSQVAFEFRRGAA